MKKLFFAAILMSSVLSFVFSLPALNAQTQPLVSMDFQDANLKDVLKALSIQSGMNFIASEAVQDRKVTLYFDKVPLDEAMDKLFSANNMSYTLDPKANIFIVKDWGKLETETITKVFTLKYATVSSSSLKEEMANQVRTDQGFSVGESGTSDSSSTSSSTSDAGKWKVDDESGITTAVRKLLSENGSVIEDFRTNSLIVTDTPARMKVISEVIASLDMPSCQVLLEVEMLDVSKNVVDSIGFEFGTSPFTAILTGATASTGFPFQGWGKLFNTGDGTLSINPTGSTYQMQLDFLRTQSDTKFLARPKILTLNNETAEVRIATNESIGLKTSITSVEGTGTTTTEAERFETGVILRVTPQVNAETGEITMFVYPRVAEAVTGNQFTSDDAVYQFRDPEERSTKSVVRVQDGETVVLGGLIRNEFVETSSKLPVLGDLPFIGFLFRHRGGSASSPDKNKQRELLVFITPHIIKDRIALRKIQAQNINLPAREQSMPVVDSRDYIISTSLNNFKNRR